MKTYFDIIRDVSNLRWSVVDTDPSSFAEVQKAVKLAIQQANSYIWGLDNFPFKVKKEAFKINKGQSALPAPKGSIVNIWLDGSNTYLEEISQEKADFLSGEEKGKPVCFWIEFGDEGAEVHFYPKASEDCTMLIRYITNCKARAQDGTLKANLSDMDDVLNLPDDSVIEDLFLHCLNTKAMEYLIADTNDENYQPYQKEFAEAYSSLLCFSGVKHNPRLIV